MRDRKTVGFGTGLLGMIRRVFTAVTPPILIPLIQWIRDQFLYRYLPSSTLFPHPSEYSTLDNPIEVPSQVECYLLCREKYLKPTDTVLDVGFGLGYGLQIMAAKVEKLIGVEVDMRAVDRARRIFSDHPRVSSILPYDGIHLPLQDKSVDVVTCIEVLEHVPEYKDFLSEMARVARRAVFISTPNRQPRNTLPNGRPKNYWHLREWSKNELVALLDQINGIRYELNFLDCSHDGQLSWRDTASRDTQSLVPVLFIDGGN